MSLEHLSKRSDVGMIIILCHVDFIRDANEPSRWGLIC